MPWCPKCRNEYREGFSVCAECKVALVDSLEDAIEQEEAPPEEGLVPPETAAKEEGAAALEEATQEEEAAALEEMQEEAPAQDEPEVCRTYVNSAARAEDNRSSAYTLLVVGGVGFIAVLLIFFEILPVYQNAVTTKYLVCGVMGAMFVLFIVFGVVSMRSSKLLFRKAETENSLIAEMTRWCRENLTVEKVDVALAGDVGLAEEQKYFVRVEQMKKLIGDKFLNLDEAFLDHFVDEFYQTLYEDNDNLCG